MIEPGQHVWIEVGSRRVCKECRMDVGTGQSPRWEHCYGVCSTCGGFGFHMNDRTGRMQICKECPR